MDIFPWSFLSLNGDDLRRRAATLIRRDDRTVNLTSESGSITFGQPRDIDYECSIHLRQMHMKIIVK